MSLVNDAIASFILSISCQNRDVRPHGTEISKGLGSINIIISLWPRFREICLGLEASWVFSSGLVGFGLEICEASRLGLRFRNP